MLNCISLQARPRPNIPKLIPLTIAQVLDSGLTIVVGIPALGEKGTIAKVVVRSRTRADEVLVVDDGSNDQFRLPRVNEASSS